MNLKKRIRLFILLPAVSLSLATLVAVANQAGSERRVRLKASFDISQYSPPLQVILRALCEQRAKLLQDLSELFGAAAPVLPRIPRQRLLGLRA